jgi:dTDP-4-amino-4,6-dideoxygalactose transaminase
LSKLAVLGGKPSVPKKVTALFAGSKTPYPSSYPLIGDGEIKEVMSVLKSRRFCFHTSDDSKNIAFSGGFAKYVGVKYAIAVNSGTAALHCAIAAAGAGPGDEVITSPYSFIASAQCILHNNAVPIFADIDPRTYCIDPEDVERKITDRTKAIIAVHIHGNVADMKKLKEISEAHSIPVIEDAAQAHGAEYDGKKVGGIGDMGCFSFQESKNMTCGEGGMFVTNNEEFYQRARKAMFFGEALDKEEREYISRALGWNYRMPEICAAIGIAQLKRLDKMNKQRIANAKTLTKYLSEIDGITPPYVASNVKHVYYQYAPLFDKNKVGISRDSFWTAVKAEGVVLSGYSNSPLYLHPVIKDFAAYGKGCPYTCPYYGKPIHYEEGLCPTAEKIWKSVFALYVHPPLDQKDMMAYGEAFQKVASNISELKAAGYE